MTRYIDDIVALTADLIRIPSTDERPDQLSAAINYAEQYLTAVPGVYLARSERNNKPALTATLRDTRAPTLMLNAHLDVVAAEARQWEPEVRGGRLYGRGSQDMKGSAAVLLRLLKALADLETPPDIGVQFVSDEEIGGADGTGRLVEEGWQCAFFIAAEPTDLRICYAHKGGMPVEVALPGRAAHGSKPWEGANPILASTQGLSKLAARFPQPDRPTWVTTVTPTEIHGGTGSRNQLPSDVQIAFDIRYIAEDAPETILQTIRDCFPDAALTYRATPPLATDPELPVVQQLAQAAQQVRGVAPEFFREHYCTDARFYGALGIPAVCFGPIGGGLHTAEEWVDIESLSQLYAVFERLCLMIDAGR